MFKVHWARELQHPGLLEVKFCNTGLQFIYFTSWKRHLKSGDLVTTPGVNFRGSHPGRKSVLLGNTTNLLSTSVVTKNRMFSENLEPTQRRGPTPDTTMLKLKLKFVKFDAFFNGKLICILSRKFAMQ